MSKTKEIRDQFLTVRLTQSQHEALKKMATENYSNPATIMFQILIKELATKGYLNDNKPN